MFTRDQSKIYTLQRSCREDHSVSSVIKEKKMSISEKMMRIKILLAFTEIVKSVPIDGINMNEHVQAVLRPLYCSLAYCTK